MMVIKGSKKFFDGKRIDVNNPGSQDKAKWIRNTNEAFTKYTFLSQEENTPHTPESYENGIFDAIEKGDVEALKRRSKEPVNGRVGILSKDPIRQLKYIAVASGSLFARAAVRGGLDHETACSISDVFVQQADLLTDSEELIALISCMSVYFCEQVAEHHSRNRYTHQIKICCEHIQKNLHGNITLSVLSEICKLSPRRLSKKFREETGMPIVDYIHTAKMKEAAFLLKYTTFSLIEISNFLNYSSQGYFSGTFKKLYKISPLQYRTFKEKAI